MVTNCCANFLKLHEEADNKILGLMVSLNLTADAEIRFFGLFSGNFDSSRENYPIMVSQKGVEAADTDLISKFCRP